MKAYRDRRDAGRQLGGVLAEYASEHPIVLALPRGGVPVGYEIARQLGAALDVLVVCKIAVPGREELAMGAVAHGGAWTVDRQVVARTGVTQRELEDAIAEELPQLERRERALRGDLPRLDVRGRTVIAVDDGLVTGTTTSAAIDALRSLAPAEIVCAAPVATAEACEVVARRADRVVALITPRRMFAVDLWYEDDSQPSDAEIRALLDAARPREETQAAFGE